jgi:hypothetical protein
MKRKPIYDDVNQRVRVISCANGLWQAQKFVGREDHLRQVDSGWRSIGRPTTRENAIRQMGTVR